MNLARRFQAILEDPYCSTEKRRELLLAWAWENRLEIIERLQGGPGKPEYDNPDGPTAA